MNRTILLSLVTLALMSPNAIAKKNMNKENSNNYSASNASSNGSTQRNESQKMGAIEVISQDHSYIRQTIDRLNKNLDENVAESRVIFKELKSFLVKHETMEQKIWYPALEKKNDDLKKIIADLKKQEQDASKALSEIDKTKDDKEWVSKVKDFVKKVDDHAKSEENNLFPKVKETLDQATLDTIGEKLNQYHTKNKMKM